MFRFFMIGEFVVAENNGETTITLGRPPMTSEMNNSPELAKVAGEVEERLTAILTEAAGQFATS